jgi:hypothetical protein
MWADRYLKNTLQLKFLHLARVLGETLKISVNTKHRNSVGELISEYSPSPNWVTHVEYSVIFVDCYELSHTPLR